MVDHNYYFQNNEPTDNLTEYEDIWINVEGNETFISKDDLDANTDENEPDVATLGTIWIGSET